jgi:hypothetical protein
MDAEQEDDTQVETQSRLLGDESIRLSRAYASASVWGGADSDTRHDNLPGLMHDSSKTRLCFC